MADQKSTIAIIKENIKKANAYDNCIKDNAEIINNVTEVRISLCYISKEYFGIIATLTSNTTEKIVSQESIKGVRPKHFEVLKSHCNIVGGVPLKKKHTATTDPGEQNKVFSEKDGTPLTKAETYRIKATAYDGCVQEKTTIKGNYTECKKFAWLL